MGNLYDQDLVLWSEQQARELRAAASAGWNAPIDWQNLAEEIESLGRSERHALASHIGTVIEHLLKLEVSPVTEPARGWRDTVRRARRDIARLLKDSPSLMREIPAMVADELSSARSLIRASLQDYGEQPRVDMDALAYSDEQVVGEWLPDVK
jgi:Domain of unknown function DUF29